MSNAEVQALVDQGGKAWMAGLITVNPKTGARIVGDVKAVRPRQGKGLMYGLHILPRFWSKETGNLLRELYATETEAWQSLVEAAAEWKALRAAAVGRLRGEEQMRDRIIEMMPDAAVTIRSVFNISYGKLLQEEADYTALAVKAAGALAKLAAPRRHARMAPVNRNKITNDSNMVHGASATQVSQS